MIGVYCRVSTESQDDNFSIKEQRDRGSKFAESLNEDFEIYQDTFTGTTLDRPALQKLLTDIKSEKISKIWVIEFTRLSRDTIGAHTLKDILNQYNVEIYINGQLTKIENPEEYLTFGINAVITDYERRRLAERMKRGKDRKKRDGGLWFAVQPYGYESYHDEKGNRRIKVNDEEATNIHYIFDQIANHRHTLLDLTNEFNDRLIPTRKGNKWWKTNFHNIIRRSIYAGFYVYENKEVESNDYPAIVNRELWEKANNEIERRNLNHAQRHNHHKASSLFRCWHCGKFLTWANRKMPKFSNGEIEYYYYVPQYKFNHRPGCSRPEKFQAQNFEPDMMLDFWLDDQFLLFAVDGDSLLKYYKIKKAENQELEESKKQDIERLEQEQKRIKSQKKKLIDLFMKVEDDPDIEKQIKELSNKDKEIESKIEVIRNELTITSEKLAEILKDLSADLLDEYKKYSDEPFQQRKMLSRFIKDAYIRDQEIHLEWITGQIIELTFDEMRQYWEQKLNIADSIFKLDHSEDDPEELKEIVRKLFDEDIEKFAEGKEEEEKS